MPNLSFVGGVSSTSARPSSFTHSHKVAMAYAYRSTRGRSCGEYHASNVARRSHLIAQLEPRTNHVVNDGSLLLCRRTVLGGLVTLVLLLVQSSVNDWLAYNKRSSIQCSTYTNVVACIRAWNRGVGQQTVLGRHGYRVGHEDLVAVEGTKVLATYTARIDHHLGAIASDWEPSDSD